MTQARPSTPTDTYPVLHCRCGRCLTGLDFGRGYCRDCGNVIPAHQDDEW